MRIGAKYGHRISGISGHSSITNLEQLALFVTEPIGGLVPADPVDGDVFETIQRYLAALPPLRFDCGIGDPLVQANRQLHARLLEIGCPHAYHEFEGKHEWAYWERYVKESIFFFAGLLDG